MNKLLYELSPFNVNLLRIQMVVRPEQQLRRPQCMLMDSLAHRQISQLQKAVLQHPVEMPDVQFQVEGMQDK